MQLKSRFVSSSFAVAISIAATGSISVLLLASGARTIGAAEMSSFVSTWVAINTTVIALGASFDQLAPRVLARNPALAGSLALHGTLFPLAGAMTAVGVLLAVGSVPVSPVSLVLYAVAVSLWTGERSLRLGTGEFKTLALAALVAAFGSAISLVTVASLFGMSGDGLFAAASTGNLLGFIVMRTSNADRRNPFSRLPRGEYPLALSVTASSASVLVISSGALILAGGWGVADEKVVAFAGIVNFVRIPFMILNSTSGPINLELSKRAASGDTSGAGHLAMRWAALMTATSLVIAVAVALVGDIVLRVFIGPGYVFNRALAMTVVVVEAGLWIAGASRFLGIAVGRSRAVMAHWATGAIAFVVVARIEALGEARLFAAPLVGVGATLLLSTFWAVRNTVRSVSNVEPL